MEPIVLFSAGIVACCFYIAMAEEIRCWRQTLKEFVPMLVQLKARSSRAMRRWRRRLHPLTSAGRKEVIRHAIRLASPSLSDPLASSRNIHLELYSMVPAKLCTASQILHGHYKNTASHARRNFIHD